MQVLSEKARDKTGTFMTEINTSTKRCIIKARNDNLTFECKKLYKCNLKVKSSINGPV